MKRDYKRRVLPNMDKTLLAGLVRLCHEYNNLANKATTLNVKEIQQLSELSKTILQLKKDKGVADLYKLNRQPTVSKESPETVDEDILG